MDHNTPAWLREAAPDVDDETLLRELADGKHDAAMLDALAL